MYILFCTVNKANKCSLIYGIFMWLYSWLNRGNLFLFLSYQIIWLVCNNAPPLPPQVKRSYVFHLSKNMNKISFSVLNWICGPVWTLIDCYFSFTPDEVVWINIHTGSVLNEAKTTNTIWSELAVVSVLLPREDVVQVIFFLLKHLYEWCSGPENCSFYFAASLVPFFSAA